MKKASTFALTVAVVLTGTPPAQSTPENQLAAMPPTSTAVPAPPAEQVIHTDNAELEALSAWALGRFAEAGLDLPSIDLYFYSNNKPCKGYSALHRRSEAGSQIDVCSVTRTPKLEATILHEMAHAWAAHTLTDTQRQAFVELQGLDTWHHKETSWNERGTEQAAEIIAWGLGETSWSPRWIPNNDLASLTTAYQHLTGANPITNTTPQWQPGEPVS